MIIIQSLGMERHESNNQKDKVSERVREFKRGKEKQI